MSTGAKLAASRDQAWEEAAPARVVPEGLMERCQKMQGEGTSADMGSTWFTEDDRGLTSEV